MVVELSGAKLSGWPASLKPEAASLWVELGGLLVNCLSGL